MEKKTKNTELTVQTVSAGVQITDELLAKLEEIKTTSFKTSCKVPSIGGELNLKDITDLAVLRTAFSGIFARIKAEEASNDFLEIKSHPVIKLNGGTLEDWKHDFQLQAKIISTKERYDKLMKIKNDYKDLMDKNDRKLELDKELQKLAQE